jgi:hypothetical protein
VYLALAPVTAVTLWECASARVRGGQTKLGFSGEITSSKSNRWASGARVVVWHWQSERQVPVCYEASEQRRHVYARIMLRSNEIVPGE